MGGSPFDDLFDDALDPVLEVADGANRDRLADVQAELAAPAGAVGGGGGFLVDPERAQAAIRKLDEAIGSVEAGLWNFLSFTLPAPGSDEVSLNLARNGAQMARRAEVYVRTWLAQILEARAALQAQVDAYAAADADIVSRA